MTASAVRWVVAGLAAVSLIANGCRLRGGDGFDAAVVNRGSVDRLVVFQGQGMKDGTSNRQTWIAAADSQTRVGPFIGLDPSPNGEIRIYSNDCRLLRSFPIREDDAYTVTITDDGSTIMRSDGNNATQEYMASSPKLCE